MSVVALHQLYFRKGKNTADMSLSKSPINNSGIPLQEGPTEPGSAGLKVDHQEMGCRRLKRNETVGGVQLFGKQEMRPGSEAGTMLRGERKRGSFDLGEEEAERGQGPSKALCCGKRIHEDLTITTEGPHGAVVEEDLGEEGETSERKAEIHQVVPVTCLSENFGGEVELVTPDPGPKEEDQLGEASLAGESGANVQEGDANSHEQDNIFVEGATGTTSSSQQGTSLAMALLNRFPSIDGEDDEEVDDAVGGGVEEEAGQLGERWPRAEASSEPDQVWYRSVLLKYSCFGKVFFASENNHAMRSYSLQ